MTPTALIRIRFPLDTVARLDEIADEIGTSVKRRIPRAALVRAMVCLCGDMTAPELLSALDVDTVKRGRARGAKKGGAS